jgi:CCR4-NOT transcriptional complex subunit CAF120
MPHGLLSAGLHDKEERSANRQEEFGRESGAALLNVAHKPSPPPPGLLGAITAHQRERKRESGFNAASTEHEREKRATEERQDPASSGDVGATMTRTGRQVRRSPRVRRT